MSRARFLQRAMVVGTLVCAMAWGAAHVQLASAEDRAAGQAAGQQTFEIYEDRAMEFRWRLKAANGKTLASGGEGYKAKANCKKAVQRIKDGVRDDELKFEVYEDRAGEHRWRLKSANGQVVAASSEGYKAKADCEKAIASIKKSAPSAEVSDEA